MSEAPARLVWPELLRAAAAMGVPPAEFWRLSVREWLILTKPDEPSGLDRAGFDALRARFPDQIDEEALP